MAYGNSPSPFDWVHTATPNGDLVQVQRGKIGGQNAMTPQQITQLTQRRNALRDALMSAPLPNTIGGGLASLGSAIGVGLMDHRLNGQFPVAPAAPSGGGSFPAAPTAPAAPHQKIADAIVGQQPSSGGLLGALGGALGNWLGTRPRGGGGLY